MPSEVEEAVTNYRRLMQAREADAMRALANEWILIENNLQAEMSELAYIMAAKRDAGEVITQQMLWKEEKYRRLIQQAEDRIATFTKSAESLINTSQLDAYVLGVDAANGLIEAQYKSIGALSPFWERTDIRGVESMSAILQSGKPLYNLLEASYPTAIEGLTSALIEGVARGFLPGQVAENMVKNFGLGADRALLIAQTEMSRAYREGTIQQYRSTPVVEYYIRMANKATACLACIILDGTKYNKSDEMSDHPRGMCNILAKVKGVPPPQWERGEKWFKTLDEQRQRQIMGNTRFDLWKSGQVKFSQFATMSHDKVWGEAPAVLSLRSLSQKYGIDLTRPGAGASVARNYVSEFDALDAAAGDFTDFAMFKSYFDAAPQDFVSAVKLYTGSSYEDINGILRNTISTSSMSSASLTLVEMATDDLTDMIRQAPQITSAVKLYRGMQLDVDSKLYRDITKVGTVFKDSGFVSTSVAKSTAFGGNVRMEILVPKGSKLAYVDSISRLQGEKEALLQRGSMFYVRSIESGTDKYGNPTKVIKALYIGSEDVK